MNDISKHLSKVLLLLDTTIHTHDNSPALIQNLCKVWNSQWQSYNFNQLHLSNYLK